jgi:2'-5' RNA ligase
MLNAEPEPTIYHLQRSTLSALASYKEYVHPESQAWEETFKPHITIVSDVNSTDYQQAIKELGKNYTCRGIIRDVALIIVDNMVPREADNPENQIIYPL